MYALFSLIDPAIRLEKETFEILWYHFWRTAVKPHTMSVRVAVSVGNIRGSIRMCVSHYRPVLCCPGAGYICMIIVPFSAAQGPAISVILSPHSLLPRGRWYLCDYRPVLCCPGAGDICVIIAPFSAAQGPASSADHEGRLLARTWPAAAAAAAALLACSPRSRLEPRTLLGGQDPTGALRQPRHTPAHCRCVRVYLRLLFVAWSSMAVWLEKQFVLWPTLGGVIVWRAMRWESCAHTLNTNYDTSGFGAHLM